MMTEQTPQRVNSNQDAQDPLAAMKAGDANPSTDAPSSNQPQDPVPAVAQEPQDGQERAIYLLSELLRIMDNGGDTLAPIGHSKAMRETLNHWKRQVEARRLYDEKLKQS